MKDTTYIPNGPVKRRQRTAEAKLKVLREGRSGASVMISPRVMSGNSTKRNTACGLTGSSSVAHGVELSSRCSSDLCLRQL
jgi:hypothetical protein